MRTPALILSTLLAVNTTAHALERLEPSQGCYLGFTLGSTKSVSQLESTLGFAPAVYLEFFDFSSASTDFTRIGPFLEQVTAVQGIAMLTLEPHEGLENVTVVECDRIAQLCEQAESHGIGGIFIRFAHEMNGNWYAWGQRPTLFKIKFRLLAETIRVQTRRTAMVWAPNYGVGYPFGAPIPAAGSVDFAALDTNHNGQITDRDDMYEPYYPGNDVVDWVGMTIYHWGIDFPWLENELPPPNSFVNSLTGTYHGATPNFYARYCANPARQKPFAVTETSAFYNTQVSGAPEIQIKRAWWTQILAAPAGFPKLKCVNWFDELKRESIAQNNLIDWSVTGTAEIRNAFVADLRAAGLGTNFLTADQTMLLAPYSVAAKYLPEVLPVSGNVNVALDVKAEAACDLVIDLLDEDFRWQGGTRLAISTPGQTVTTSFPIAHSLTDTVAYRWSIFLTPHGSNYLSALAWYHGPNPSDDPDGDGLSNAEELIAGTSPRNAADVLALDVQFQTGRTILAWNSKVGRTYQIFTSSDFQTWTLSGLPIAGNGSRIVLSEPQDKNAAFTFYHLSVATP